ncbi:class I SAM-dependent methyltransferase [Rhodococcus sp. NPDC003318]|uniref:class I SAM-dependent methyltransferase n=1 Tax=Rhodococcus sp. NPDC003318 TaxID=3364503 RepID=UPI0036BB33EA
MHQHHSHHHHAAGEGDHAALLDLDAEALGPFLDEVTAWVATHVPAEPRTVADVGAGTGTGTLALARRFGAADIVAIDRSAPMLARVRAAASGAGAGGRLRTVHADLDEAWPEVGALDVVWAALFLHEAADPDRLLRDVHAALNPGGVLAVVEMDSFPRFLPDDIGFGRPGLESRCHAILERENWNAHPDWREHLDRAGFDVAEVRVFPTGGHPAPDATRRYARHWLGRTRDFLADKLAADDLEALDRLLAEEGPDSLVRRDDLTVRGTRTAWAARKSQRARRN